MNFNKKIKIAIGIVVSLLLVWQGLILLKRRGILHHDAHALTKPRAITNHTYVTIADLKVQTSNDGTSVKYHGFTGNTALQLLRLIDPAVETRDMPTGTFVVSMKGHTADTTHYWALYVNDHIADGSPDQYKTKNSDMIEWKYESL